MPRPCRASIFAMVGSKLTINAQPPESVRVRLDLRWLGSRPGRVPVNTPERFNPESVPPPDSTLPLDAAARVVGQGPPPVALAHRQAPRHRGGRRPRLTALPPPGAPRTHLESSSNRPRSIRPAFPSGRTTPKPRDGRPFGRHPAAQNQPARTRRSPAQAWGKCALQPQDGANPRQIRRTRGAPAWSPHHHRPQSRSQRSHGGLRRARASGQKKISRRMTPKPTA